MLMFYEWPSLKSLMLVKRFWWWSLIEFILIFNITFWNNFLTNRQQNYPKTPETVVTSLTWLLVACRFVLGWQGRECWEGKLWLRRAEAGASAALLHSGTTRCPAAAGLLLPVDSSSPSICITHVESWVGLQKQQENLKWWNNYSYHIFVLV